LKNLHCPRAWFTKLGGFVHASVAIRIAKDEKAAADVRYAIPGELRDAIDGFARA